MVGREPSRVVLLEQPQPALVELVDGHVAAVQVIEDPDVHPVPPSRSSGLWQGYTPLAQHRGAGKGGSFDGDSMDASTGTDPGGRRGDGGAHARSPRAVLRALGLRADRRQESL